ncbi:hypothetical protein [Kribbella sp. ALI-6-A]|nr:hypothetical protein [Kribbella sp. ALI-6-A]
MRIGVLIWIVGLAAVLGGLVATLRYRLVIGTTLIVTGFVVAVAGVEIVG